MSYVKLSQTILDSTIWAESSEIRIVWITLLVMANREGECYSSLPGLARRAGVPLEKVEIAIEKFQSPDPYSRTPDYEGRRIEPIPGGWQILNFQKYRDYLSREDQKRKNAERQKRYRDRKNRYSNATVTPSNPTVTPSNVTDRYTVTPSNVTNRYSNATVTHSLHIADTDTDTDPDPNTDPDLDPDLNTHLYLNPNTDLDLTKKFVYPSATQNGQQQKNDNLKKKNNSQESGLYLTSPNDHNGHSCSVPEASSNPKLSISAAGFELVQSKPKPKTRKQPGPEFWQRVTEVYNQHKPDLWAKLTKPLSSQRGSALTQIWLEYGQDQALAQLENSLRFAQQDKFWGSKPFAIDNLLRQGRVTELSERWEATQQNAEVLRAIEDPTQILQKQILDRLQGRFSR